MSSHVTAKQIPHAIMQTLCVATKSAVKQTNIKNKTKKCKKKFKTTLSMTAKPI